MLEYIDTQQSYPDGRGEYLCRLVDNRKRPFYRVMQWYGAGFYDGMIGPYANVTHWAEIPTFGDEEMREL